MNNEQQHRGISGLVPGKVGAQVQTSHDGLNDVTNTVDSVANGYDVEYRELCHMLKDAVDSVECIRDHRKSNITSIRDGIEHLINAVDQARRSAGDTNTLAYQRDEVERLEKEKKQVVMDIIRGKDEKERLRDKLQHVEQLLRVTREDYEVVKGEGGCQVASLEYMKKVLHRVSQVYVTTGDDGGVLQGFVSQNRTADVRPFRFDESTCQFEQVNHLWEMICEDCK